jgi:hypothetical protein
MLVNFTSPSVVSVPVVPKEMLSVSEEGGKTKVKINSSSLSVIQECPRKAKYSLLDKWKPETEGPALAFGTAIHKALEVFYLGSPEERILPDLCDMELMACGHNVPGEEYSLLHRATRAFVDKAQVLSALPAEDKRSLQSGVWLLFNYFKSYLDDPYVAYVDDQGPLVERTFSFRLYEDETTIIEYFGTIDLVVRHRGTGDILVCDHKTSSVVGNDFYNRLKPNHQYTGYLLGAREALGIQTNSFLINCLQVKEKPKTVRGTAPHLPRQVTTRDEEDYAEFVAVVASAVSSFLAFRETGIWPLGPTNVCANYGGCSFLSVCSAPSSLRENILRSKFKQGDLACPS